MTNLGLYLAAPHGRLIYDGEKTVIATAKRLPITGDRVICSKEHGQGLAFGIASIGDPASIDALAFDDRFHEHRVAHTSRLKWWKDATHLYLYPVQRFEPFSLPREIEIAPGTIMDMGEIDSFFDLPSSKSEESPLVIMSSSSKISEEETMPFSPKDATEFTKKADTPEKQKLWADTANGRLDQCESDGGAVKDCEASAIRIANAAVARKKEIEEMVDARVKAILDAAAPGEETPCNCEAPCAECEKSHHDEEPDEEKKDKKAGRRFSGSILEKLRGLGDTIAELIGHGEYADAKPEPTAVEGIVSQITPTVKGFKSLGTDEQGRTWFMLWPTNAYFDREGEAFSTKAISDYVERHSADEIKGVADVWHVPGSEFGTIRHQAVVADHFVCQLGTYDNTLIGQAFKRFFEAHPDGHDEIAPHGWGASHQYDYKHEDRADGVYTVFDIEKSTVLPLHKAANIFNPTPVMGGFKMDEEQKAAFDAVGAELGLENLAEQVIAMGKSAKEALDSAEVPRKSIKAEQVPEEDESPDDDEEKKDEKSAVDGLVATLVERLGLHDLSTTIGDLLDANKSLQEQLVEVKGEMTQVKQAKEETVEQVLGTPRYAWNAFQASKAAETVDPTAPATSGMPDAVKSIASQLLP